MAALRESVAHASELVQQGRLPEARTALGELLARTPDHAEALHLAGMVELMSGWPAGAVPLFRRCVEIAPAVSFAWSNLGVAYNACGDFTNALEAFQKALELAPGAAATLKNQGIALRHLGRHEEAMASFRRAAQREPNDFELHREVGDLLVAMGRPGEALSRYDRALAANPQDVASHHHRGVAALRAGHADRAEQDLRRAMALSPRDPFIQNELGVALEALGRHEDAIAAYDHAIALRADFVEALENRAASLAGLRRFEAALAGYERVEALAPGRPYNAGHRLQARLALCDWTGFEALVTEISAGLAAGRREAQPFPLCYVDVPQATRRRCAELYSQDILQGIPPVTWRRPPYFHKRVRVGYFSADLREHPVGRLLAPLAEAHDRSRVKAFAFAFGPPASDPVRARLERAFERVEDVGRLPAGAIADLARSLEIDVAVDLMGHTSGARTQAFAQRMAPVQAQFMGFPGTMGAACIDYLVADRVVVPGEHFAHYTENVAWVRSSALVAERGGTGSAAPERAALGLPEAGFVFCCFCQRAKITPDAFDAWMRILARVEGSVLWLADPGEAAARNLRAEAERRGIAGARLVFAARVPEMADHLARLGAADLFLDTFHYGGHVTASDALQAGLPVLARLGEAFPARVSASLLRAVGLEELVTDSTRAYETLAVALARDPERLRALRERLEASLPASPAFDPAALARDLEELYARMVARHQSGLAPAPIALDPG